MKTRLLLAAGLVAGFASAGAATEYQGDFFVVKTSKACEASPFFVGAYIRGRFAPAGLSGNGDDTSFGLHWGRYSTSYVTKGEPAKKYTKASSVGILAGHWSWKSSKVSYADVSPSNIKESTGKIDMVVKIKNADSFKNCTITLDGSVTKRPGS